MAKISVELDARTKDVMDEIPYGKKSEVVRKALQEYLRGGNYDLRQALGEFNRATDEIRKYGYEVTIWKKKEK